MYKICHTEESSRRQRELELVLLEAMLRQPYERITLTELCQKAQIPRKTFYRYFPTKDDCLLALMDHTLTDCNDIALQGWEGTGYLDHSTQLRFFRFWMQRRKFLDAVRDNGLRYLLLDRTTVIVDKMEESSRTENFAREQVKYFIAHGLMATVLRWHHFGFPESPEKMAEVFGPILQSTEIALDRLLL